MISKALFAAVVASFSIAAVPAQEASHDKSTITLVYDHELSNVPGKSIKGVLVEYEPGGASPCTHPP